MDPKDTHPNSWEKHLNSTKHKEEQHSRNIKPDADKGILRPSSPPHRTERKSSSYDRTSSQKEDRSSSYRRPLSSRDRSKSPIRKRPYPEDVKIGLKGQQKFRTNIPKPQEEQKRREESRNKNSEENREREKSRDVFSRDNINENDLKIRVTRYYPKGGPDTRVALVSNTTAGKSPIHEPRGVKEEHSRKMSESSRLDREGAVRGKGMENLGKEKIHEVDGNNKKLEENREKMRVRAEKTQENMENNFRQDFTELQDQTENYNINLNTSLGNVMNNLANNDFGNNIGNNNFGNNLAVDNFASNYTFGNIGNSNFSSNYLNNNFGNNNFGANNFGTNNFGTNNFGNSNFGNFINNPNNTNNFGNFLPSNYSNSFPTNQEGNLNFSDLVTLLLLQNKIQNPEYSLDLSHSIPAAILANLPSSPDNNTFIPNMNQLGFTSGNSDPALYRTISDLLGQLGNKNQAYFPSQVGSSDLNQQNLNIVGAILASYINDNSNFSTNFPSNGPLM